MATITPLKMLIASGIELDIRSLESSDASIFLDFLAQLPHESNHTMQYVGKKLLTLDETKSRIEKFRLDRATLDVGVFDGSKLIGFLNFRMPDPDHPWMQHLGRFGMMIRKDYWGQGVGKKLLSLFEPHAIKLGITKIEAEVRCANERGVVLYKNFGYEIEGRRRHAVKIDGQWGDEFFIAKFLNKKDLTSDLPTLETSRLVLRPLTLADANGIFAYAKNPNVSRYTLWEPHVTVNDSLNYIRDYAFKHYQDGAPEPFGVVLKSDPEHIIGTVGCFWVSKNHGSMELAYALDEKYWGRGIAAEASGAVIDHCFNQFSLKRIQARCKAENLPSAKVMQKIGMAYEGTLKSSLYHRGRHWDICCYAIVK